MQDGGKWGRHPACQSRRCRLEACTTRSDPFALLMQRDITQFRTSLASWDDASTGLAPVGRRLATTARRRPPYPPSRGPALSRAEGFCARGRVGRCRVTALNERSQGVSSYPPAGIGARGRGEYRSQEYGPQLWETAPCPIVLVPRPRPRNRLSFRSEPLRQARRMKSRGRGRRTRTSTMKEAERVTITGGHTPLSGST